MNIEYFYNFLEVANQKSLSKASERLNISQPALSKQIRKIEEYFDEALLHRFTSGVELTEAGRVIYEKLPGILNELESIQIEIDHRKELRSYTIGTIPSLAANYIPSIILKLNENRINTKLIVKNTSNEVYELLKSGELDIAIIEKMPINHGFWQKGIFEDPLYAVFHHTHKLSKNKSVTLEEMKNEDFVLYPANCSIRQSLSEMVKEIKIITEIDFGEYLIGFVAAGGGITVVPEITAKHIGNSMVKAVPIMNPAVNRHISFISHSKTVGQFLFKYFKM